MLKRKIVRKILISLGAMFACFLIYLVPANDDITNVSIASPNIDYNRSSIYLLDSNNLIGKTSVITSSDNPIDLAKELIDILIIGGKGESSIPSGFTALIQSDTILNGITLENGILHIDFNDKLIEGNVIPIVEALTYTLTELPSVQGIEITVDGNDLNSYIKDMFIPSFLDRSFGINKKYDITSLDNIKGVTTYYVSKFNDDIYYVPVTKYVNDEREHIKIIIEDLTSSNTYMTNLMSFMNSNTKLLKTNINNNTMELTFNSYILSDFNDSNILKEVIDTVSLSIKDNYDVDEVVFYALDNEIYKKCIKSIE